MEDLEIWCTICYDAILIPYDFLDGEIVECESEGRQLELYRSRETFIEALREFFVESVEGEKSVPPNCEELIREEPVAGGDLPEGITAFRCVDKRDGRELGYRQDVPANGGSISVYSIESDKRAEDVTE